MKLFVFYIICLLAMAASSIGQQQPAAYSESGAYMPRVVKQKDKKKKADGAMPPSPFADSKPMSIRVSVLNGNWEPVAGLSKKDFKLFVDDQESEIASVETKNEPMNFVFMIDISSSSSTEVKSLAERVERVIDQLAPGDRAMAITFSGTRKVICELTDDHEKLRKAVKKGVLNQGNGTALYDLVREFTLSMLPKIQGTTSVILFTDGVDTTSRGAMFDTSLVTAESSDAAYYVIYLDTIAATLKFKSKLRQPSTVAFKPVDPKQEQLLYDVGKFYLNDLMALSGGYIALDTAAASTNANITSNLLMKIRSQYIVTFTPRSGSVVGQRHSLNVRVNRPNLSVIARGSYITSEK